MISLKKTLSSVSTLLENKKVKIVRHKDGREEYRDAMKSKEEILKYQNFQTKEIFKNCDYIISFQGIEKNRALFLGVFKVMGVSFNKKENLYKYQLKHIEDFEQLEDRLVINWGSGALAYHQWFNDKEIFEILPKGYVGHFPGLLDFTLNYQELQKLINHENENHEWKNHLSSVNGIYLILDKKNKLQYIGAAYGRGGIWQRWQNYAQTGHGGNKIFKKLYLKDKEYTKHFLFSVLQTLPSNLTPKEVIKIENLYKEKLGSRAHGLNGN